MPGSRPQSDRRAHLERSRRVWDRWSDHYGLSERDFEPVRREAIAALELEPGEAVLDAGCGPGVNFELLRSAVGSEGLVLGVDLTPGMVEGARARIDDRGWTNVAVAEADATRPPIADERFDAAVATLALSTMPDVRAAVEAVSAALRPGGRFAVVDLRRVPSGPARLVNPILSRLFSYLANWNPEGDVLAELRRAFDDVEVVATRAAGVNYTAVARVAAD